ncbi:MAG: GntR family transcriptional regulator [Treponema sp.]|nr:GntR family transcriptional regulator [Treponema sp.]
MRNDISKGHFQRNKVIPRYWQIYDHLLGEINTGNLKPGEQIPSEREICDNFKVSKITSKKALEMLVENNLIIRHRGKGSFVSGTPTPAQLEKSVSLSKSIVFITPAFSDSFGKKLLYSVQAACEALGYHLILKLSHESVEEEEKALRSVYDENVAGVLILPSHGEHYAPELLKHILNKYPLVFIDRKMRGLPVPSITTDGVASTEMAIKWLFDLGHRNIAFYSGSVLHTSTVEDRLQGFTKAFVDNGIPLNPAHICDNLPFSNSLDMLSNHLSEHPEITAAFSAEFLIALRVKQVLAAQGKTIPKDFALVTYDNPDYPGEFTEFSYLIQNEEALGKQAVKTLHRIIQEKTNDSIDNILIPAELIRAEGFDDSRKSLKTI